MRRQRQRRGGGGAHHLLCLALAVFQRALEGRERPHGHAVQWLRGRVACRVVAPTARRQRISRRDGCHDQLPRRAVELRSHSGKQFSRRFGLTLSLPSFPAALPVVDFFGGVPGGPGGRWPASLSRQLLPGALTSLAWLGRSEEHTSELQ